MGHPITRDFTEAPAEPAAEPLRFDAPLTVGAQIEARAAHPATGDKLFLMQGERRWTYRHYRDECVRMAHFLLRRLERIDDSRPGHVAMFMENHLELLSLYGGCAYAGLTLFGVNTGLRGEVLADVLNHSRARLLVVDQKFAAIVERIRSHLHHVPAENILVLRTGEEEVPREMDLSWCLDAEIGAVRSSLAPPDAHVGPEQVLMVIYTSGTTALPKGIKNNHLKMCAVGIGVSATLGLTSADTGYTSMPLARYRKVDSDNRENFMIGCIILVEPFFFDFDRDQWIAVPAGFSRHVQQGKGYDAGSGDGRRLWNEVQERLHADLRFRVAEADAPVWGSPILVRQRLGQGAFRVLVTDNYERQCAVTWGKALPVLEAAHIRPVSKSGKPRVDNGILLRSDVHKLFDEGYLTISPNHQLRVSSRLKVVAMRDRLTG